MTNQCCLSFVKVAANSRKIFEFGIAKKFGFVVFVGISSPLLTVSDQLEEKDNSTLNEEMFVFALPVVSEFTSGVLANL